MAKIKTELAGICKSYYTANDFKDFLAWRQLGFWEVAEATPEHIAYLRDILNCNPLKYHRGVPPFAIFKVTFEVESPLVGLELSKEDAPQ